MIKKSGVVCYWFWQSIILMLELTLITINSFSIGDILLLMVLGGFVASGISFGVLLLVHNQIIWYRNTFPSLHRKRLSEPVLFLVLDIIIILLFVSILSIASHDGLDTFFALSGLLILCPIIASIIAYRYYWMKILIKIFY